MVQVAKPKRTAQSSVSMSGLLTGGLSLPSGGSVSFDMEHQEYKLFELSMMET